jgi:hypothetical protein
VVRHQPAPQRQAATGCNVRGNLAAAAAEVLAADQMIGSVQPRVISEQGFFSKGVVAGTFGEVTVTTACINGQTQSSKSARAFQAPVETGGEYLGVLGTFLGGAGQLAGGIGIASGAMRVEQKVIIKKHNPCCN